MRLLIIFLTSLLTAALLSGCSTRQLSVRSDYDHAYPFRQLHTWGWTNPPRTLETDAATQTDQRIQLDDLVKAHVEQALGQKGYRLVGQQPDFQVAWSFGEWALDRHKSPNGGYGAVGLMYPGLHGSIIPVNSDGRAEPPSLDPYSSKYEQAKLELLVTDARTSKVIWNATVTDDTDFGYFKANQRDRIGAAVDRLLDGFPPPGVK